MCTHRSQGQLAAIQGHMGQVWSSWRFTQFLGPKNWVYLRRTTSANEVTIIGQPVLLEPVSTHPSRHPKAYRTANSNGDAMQKLSIMLFFFALYLPIREQLLCHRTGHWIAVIIMHEMHTMFSRIVVLCHFSHSPMGLEATRKIAVIKIMTPFECTTAQ